MGGWEAASQLRRFHQTAKFRSSDNQHLCFSHHSGSNAEGRSAPDQAATGARLTSFLARIGERSLAGPLSVSRQEFDTHAVPARRVPQQHVILPRAAAAPGSSRRLAPDAQPAFQSRGCGRGHGVDAALLCAPQPEPPRPGGARLCATQARPYAGSLAARCSCGRRGPRGPRGPCAPCAWPLPEVIRAGIDERHHHAAADSAPSAAVPGTRMRPPHLLAFVSYTSWHGIA